MKSPQLTVESPLVISHGEKIASLTEGQKSLERAVMQLTTNVTKMGDILTMELQTNREATHREINTVKDMVASIGKPNYGTWIAGVSVIVVLVVALLSPIWSGQAAAEHRAGILREDLNEHMRLPIHPVAAQQIKDDELLANERDRENNRRFDEMVERLERRLSQEKELLNTKLSYEAQLAASKIELQKAILEQRVREQKP